jgi:ketosteroid isomerase-like protein
MAQGREAIVAAFKATPPLPPGATMKVTPMEIRVLSPDWAYALGVDTLTYTPPGAAQSKKETSTFLVLIKRTPEGWKTYREVLSANQK